MSCPERLWIGLSVVKGETGSLKITQSAYKYKLARTIRIVREKTLLKKHVKFTSDYNEDNQGQTYLLFASQCLKFLDCVWKRVFKNLFDCLGVALKNLLDAVKFNHLSLQYYLEFVLLLVSFTIPFCPFLHPHYYPFLPFFFLPLFPWPNSLVCPFVRP